MIIEQGESATKSVPVVKRRGLWLRLLISLLLGAAALVILGRNIELVELGQALAAARPGPIVAGLGVILLTTLAKTWRWQLLYRPHTAVPAYRPLFWALILGQFVNALLPFRLGDLARVYALRQQSGTSAARSLGTLVLEKAMDTIMLALSLVLLLPVVVVPSSLRRPGITLAIIALLALVVLFLLAYHARRLVGLLQLVAQRLPPVLGQRLVRLAISGLEGLNALRDRRTSTAVVLSSAAIAILAALTPLVLFATFDLDLGVTEAVLLNFVVSVGSSPPSTPAKVGIFEWLTILTLRQFNLTNDALLLGYALVFHLVVVLPQIVLGSVAAVRLHARSLLSLP